jgi:hypothetical protein
MRQLLVTANVFRSSPILVTLMMEALCSSETLVPTKAIQCNITENNFFIVTAMKAPNLTLIMSILELMTQALTDTHVLHRDDLSTAVIACVKHGCMNKN